MNYTSTIKVPELAVASCDYANDEHYEKYVRPYQNEIYNFVNEIALNQPNDLYNTVNILWNKGRYFELSCYIKDIIRFVSQSAKIKIQYDTMLVGNKYKLEAVVKAFNKKGYYCHITQYWI